MRILFLIIVLIHGLIHLMGFAKAFHLSEIQQLKLPISKPVGILWLAATVFFLVFIILYYLNSRYDWFIGVLAVLISQILIFVFWEDAKYGSLANLLIVLVCFINFGEYFLYREFTNNVKNDFATNNSKLNELVIEADIAHLPILVQKYLRYTKAVGQPKVYNFRAEFTGGIRTEPDSKFMEFKSVQYNFYKNPSRYFYLAASQMGFPIKALHYYQNETATFRVKLLNWLTMVDAKGDELNQAETVTLLNDMCFIAPPTLIDKRITWKVIDENSVQASFTNGNQTVSATLYFNKKGELVNFMSKDRPATDGKAYENAPWITPVQDYKMINGYLLPGRADLIYQKPDGDFKYGELEFKNVAYNL